ncbi:hypothetical protein HaLaN_21251 [Haematococcus lacustris]|uniref:Uncharacterized protein n=1 Tax=Haematococcus lacustris TaxID=44745 RepID=A0A699ZNV4_HAELA|nr:hypothetical protein HaLaN_21251 [Haematococcus lacustris]
MKVPCSVEVGKGTEDKAAGSVQLDKRDALGDGIVFYPSLRPAVTVCKLPEGQIITAFLDASGGKVLTGGPGLEACCPETCIGDSEVQRSAQARHGMVGRKIAPGQYHDTHIVPSAAIGRTLQASHA